MLRIHVAPPPPRLTERENRRPEPAPRTLMTENAAAQNSRVGERNFAASVVRFAVEKLATAAEAVVAPPPPSCPDINRLVMNHAPILVFHPDEQNFPASITEFLKYSGLHEHKAVFGDKTIDRWDVDPEQLSSLDDDHYYFVNLHNDYRQKLSRKPDETGKSTAPIYYQVDQGPPLKVTYEVFYAYNDGPGPQNHEGDVERITVEFKTVVSGGESRYEPHMVHFSAHEGHSGPISWEAATDENGRLLVYVAKGSHANFYSPGNTPTLYDAPDYVPRQTFYSPEVVLGQPIERLIDDETATDRNGDGRVNGGDGAILMDTAQSPLLNVREQAWYPKKGPGAHLGEKGEHHSTSGPQGPSEEKGPVG